MAIKQGLIYTNPCDAADLPPVVKPEIHPLTEAQIKLFLQEIETSPFRNVFAVTLFAALREGECLGLSWRQIDFEQGSIQVDQQLQRLKKNGEYCIAPYTKSKRLKKIYPPKYTFDFLRDEQARQQANRSRAGDVWSNPDDLVFTNEIGGHLAIHTFYTNLKRIGSAIGRPDMRPHDLRHTAATVAIASGADIKSVQCLLRHADAGFTLNRYGHATESMQIVSAEKTQQFYDSILKNDP